MQRLRARSSAIVTGIDTVLADDPSLNVRLGPGDLPGVEHPADVRQPLRVVLDSRLRCPPDARLLALPGETAVLCVDGPAERRAALEAAGAMVETLPAGEGRVSIAAALAWLAAREANEVLLETGATLAGAALRGGLVDELILYLAPHLMGDGARGLFRLPGLERMAERIALEIADVRHVGQDLRITARVAN